MNDTKRLGKGDVASLAEWYINKYLNTAGTNPFLHKGYGLYRHGLFDILWHDKSVVPKSPEELGLPLTQLFGGPTEFYEGKRSGLGWLIMRESWQDIDKVIAGFKSSPWFYHGHQGWDEGAFFIDYKSPLALAGSGNYQDDYYGNNPSEYGHDSDYQRRTISSNNVLVYKPGDEMGRPSESYNGHPTTLNDGGQQLAYHNSSYDKLDTDNPQYRGGITKFETTAGYDYAFTDLTRNYNIDNLGPSWINAGERNHNKVDMVTREFVWLKNRYFVVFDRVSSKEASYTKKWLLHMINRPVLNGAENLRLDAPDNGISDSLDSDLVTIANGEGKLFSKTLLPVNHKINIVGSNDVSRTYGGNYQFYGYFDLDAEPQIIGQDFPLRYTYYSEEQKKAMGRWRVEIAPWGVDSNRKDNLFLHVLYPCDNDPSITMPECVRINDRYNKMAGALIKDNAKNKVVMFSSDPEGKAPSPPIMYQITTTSRNTRHFLFGLKPATNYSVNISSGGGGQIISIDFGTGYTTTNEGTLVFEY